MRLNNAGEMVEKIWIEIPKFYNGFKLYGFIVMLNHIHGIIEIVEKNSVVADPRVCQFINKNKDIN